MEHEIQTLEMVVIEPATVLAAYTEGRGLDDAIDQVRAVVTGFEHDMSTVTSRKRTASLAMKVAKVKTGLDAMGKDLTTQWKEQAKKVDGSRKAMREALDELKIEARKPLTDWETEQAELEAKRIASEEAAKLAAQIESDHEIGLLLNEKLDREAIEAKAEADRQAKAQAEFEARLQAERETRIAAEAAEKATREASEKAEREKAESARQVAEAKAATERAEREAAEAIKAAEQKAEREAKAKEDARIAEERRVQAEQEAREANTAHCREINRAVLADLVAAGVNGDIAKHVIGLIAKGQIAHTSIKY